MPSPHEAVRIAIAGASSLRGKDLKQWLDDSGFPAGETRLLDEESAAGTLTEAGGEPAVIESVNEDSFEGARLAFFTGSAEFSAGHAGEARRAGATVIDLSGGLMEEPDARLWIPALDSSSAAARAEKRELGNRKACSWSASAPSDAWRFHLRRLWRRWDSTRLVLTFFQPVSERGREGIEELELQVVKLLSFEPIPQSVYGTQVGFNMLSRYGGDSAEKLSDARARIVSEVRGYLGARTPLPAIALVQAPVFYSHAFTAYARIQRMHSVDARETVVTRVKRRV